MRGSRIDRAGQTTSQNRRISRRPPASRPEPSRTPTFAPFSSILGVPGPSGALRAGPGAPRGPSGEAPGRPGRSPRRSRSLPGSSEKTRRSSRRVRGRSGTHFRSIWGRFWADFGTIVGRFWDDRGRTFRRWRGLSKGDFRPASREVGSFTTTSAPSARALRHGEGNDDTTRSCHRSPTTSRPTAQI